MAINYASKYSTKVDEAFSREAQSGLVTNSEYEFTGVKTVNVYSLPTVAMTDYTRSGSNRYGTPSDLQDNVQTMTVSKDRSFTFTIDKGDKLQTQMVHDAGRALARETRLVVIPEVDTYVFDKIARAAFANGHTSATAATKANAYELFLAAQEALGDDNVPDGGRVCLCSYRFANLLKQDPAFMRDSDKGQENLIRGIMGMVDGVRIVRVPASRLPTGCSFILAHPMATVKVQQLKDYKTHDNPPGINGWLVEGRVIYDAFVLDNKKNALWYQGTAFASSSSGTGNGGGTGGGG